MWKSVSRAPVFEAGLADGATRAEAEGYRELAAEYSASDSGRRAVSLEVIPILMEYKAGVALVDPSRW